MLKSSKNGNGAARHSFDRLPPNSPESELAVLGCCVLDAKLAVSNCVTRFAPYGASVFYDLRNQTIYESLVELNDKGAVVDAVTLVQHLRDRKLLDQVGGPAYLAGLPEHTPSALNIDAYVDTVLEKHRLRRTVQICTETVSAIFDREADGESTIDQAERDILSIRKFDIKKENLIREGVTTALNKIEDYHNQQGHLVGISSGFIDLDKLTGGFVAGDMGIIGGRPSTGKTSLAMNMAEHIAIEQRLPVGVFSMEMTFDSLVLRMICSRARVNLRNIRDGFMAERDFPKITGAAGKISNAPIHIDDARGLSVLDLRARARRMQQKHGIKIFFVDYIQLLTATIGKKRIDNRQQEITEISRSIKGLAEELKVPVIVLSQLSREMERETKGKGRRRPKLSDLRESGALEQDGDLVGLLYKPNQNDEDGQRDPDCEAINLWVGKQRNGPSDLDVYLTFLKSYTRFESAAKISDDDYPPDQPQLLDRVPYPD